MDNYNDGFFLWLNGEELPINTLELFQYVRDAPEPIPLELIKWDSLASSLAFSNTQWSALLVNAICILIEQLYEHHKIVIESRIGPEKKTSFKNELLAFEKHMSSLWAIMRVVEKHPLSAWATSRDELEDAVKQFSINSEPWLSHVMELPHIKLPISCAARENVSQRSKLRRLEAEFNRYAKKMKKCIINGQ